MTVVCVRMPLVLMGLEWGLLLHREGELDDELD